MQLAVRAALLSAFVFPGAGHLYLRRPKRACLFLLPTLAAAIWFAKAVLGPTMALARQVVAGTVPFDPTVLAARLEAQGGVSNAATICAVVLVVCWVGSIVDSFVVAQGAAPRPD